MRALFCGEADDETVEFLLERSGGNPFFVEELVAFVQETRDSDRLRELPATLHGLVAARLDALEPAERSLLEDCAVVGGERVRSRPVLALAARPDARRLLDGLAERDFLAIDHDDFHFKSELIREIAYGTLTKAERARRHAVVAPVLAARGEQADRPGRAPSRHRGRARRGARRRSTAFPATSASQAIATLMRAAERDEVGRVVAHGRAPPRPRARRCSATENTDARAAPRCSGRARRAVQRRVLDDARDDALDRARRRRATPTTATAKRWR